MDDIEIRITGPFDLFYDTLNKQLSLTYVETPSGRQVKIRFDGQMTRALWDCLALAAANQGGSIGASEIKTPTIQ